MQAVGNYLATLRRLHETERASPEGTAEIVERALVQQRRAAEAVHGLRAALATEAGR